MKRKIHIIALDIFLAVAGLWMWLVLTYTYEVFGVLSAIITIAAGIVFVFIHNWIGKITHLWRPVEFKEIFWLLLWTIPLG